MKHSAGMESNWDHSAGMYFNQNQSAGIVLYTQWYQIKTDLQELSWLGNELGSKTRGRHYWHTPLCTYVNSKKIPVYRVYCKPCQTMICTGISGTIVTPPNRQIYLYRRHHIKPAKQLALDSIYPYTCSCPSTHNHARVEKIYRVYRALWRDTIEVKF